MSIKLNVPFSDKDAVKAAGARWNNDEKTWFIPEGKSPEAFEKWLPKPTGKLYVDLVPQTSWFANLRSELLSEEWKAVKQLTYKKAFYKCEICNGKGPEHPVEAHERWDFDPVNKVQTLLRIEALCPACHEVTHIGLASIRGRYEDAVAHMMKVNGWTEEQVLKHIDAAAKVWEDRSTTHWDFDMTHLLTLNMPLGEETLKRLKLGAADRRTNTKRQSI